jgi:hypothetical protein
MPNFIETGQVIQILIHADKRSKKKKSRRRFLILNTQITRGKVKDPNSGTF